MVRWKAQNEVFFGFQVVISDCVLVMVLCIDRDMSRNKGYGYISLYNVSTGMSLPLQFTTRPSFTIA